MMDLKMLLTMNQKSEIKIMGKAVKIFVEGIADVKFISDYISHIIPKIETIGKETIIDSSGWTNNRETSQNLMQQNTDNAGINLVIFDADNEFEKRVKELEEWKKSASLSFEIFLFPNNKEAGALENLLEEIILDNNKPIFDCWNGYESCLKSKTIEGRKEPLTVPAKKTKIYGYLETLLGTTKKEKEKIKEKNRDYKNTAHWNLDSAHLEPLKDFLLKHINA